MKKASLAINQNRLMVSGELTFYTVPELWTQSINLISQLSAIEIDLSQVILTKSAALALFVEWMKLARKQKKLITFMHVPHQLLTIAKLGGLGNLFGRERE